MAACHCHRSTIRTPVMTNYDQVTLKPYQNQRGFDWKLVELMAHRVARPFVRGWLFAFPKSALKLQLWSWNLVWMIRACCLWNVLTEFGSDFKHYWKCHFGHNLICIKYVIFGITYCTGFFLHIFYPVTTSDFRAVLLHFRHPSKTIKVRAAKTV